MSRPLIECFAVVHPIGHRPFKEHPELRFREDKQLKDQLAKQAKHLWYRGARNILVEVRRETVNKQLTITGEIVVDQRPAAKFSLHAHSDAPQRVGA